MAEIDVDPIDGDDPWERVVLAAFAFGGVLVVGTVAYRVLGLSWLDAFYQTLITVTTVGYGEIGDNVGPGYRVVSSALILVGVGIGVYGLGQVFGALLEGRLTDHVGRSRMRKEIDRLDGHTVVCGWGQVGRAITAALARSGERVVVVDRDPSVVEGSDHLAVVGEATDDEVLVAAGIERARSLVVALDGESDNLFVTLSGRALNPSLFIVTRAVGPGSRPKLTQAGANRVVNPHEIGADRMTSFVLHPNVADFLGETMSHDRYEVRLGELRLPLAAIGAPGERSLRDVGLLGATGLTLLAVRRADGTFEHRRDDEWFPVADDVLIVLGTPDEHDAAEGWLASHR